MARLASEIGFESYDVRLTCPCLLSICATVKGRQRQRHDSNAASHTATTDTDAFLFMLQALYEKECNMALQDKVQEQTNEAKNALEAYVYGLRNKLYDQLSEYVTDDFKESTSKKLEQMEVRFFE